MLIDKKFIFLSLPRCASTSFLITCLKNNISVEHFDTTLDNQLSKIDNWETKTNEELADSLTHLHESVFNLQKKFGNDYKIISVRRNKYERFLSLWKHIIDETLRIEKKEIAKILSKLTIDDILDGITPNDISNYKNRELIINKFLDNFKISQKEWYLKNMLDILYMPIVELTNDDSKILWFDINRLDELNAWVSKTIGRKFKLESSNSSQNFNCLIDINDSFKEKYDNLFNIFEKRKINKTLI